jgi:DNA-binding GntR family transcriptional regulator
MHPRTSTHDTLNGLEILLTIYFGQQAARNPLLDQIPKDLEPSTRRAQFASLSLRTEDLKQNVAFFEHAARYVEEQNGEMASQIICACVQNEKEFALKNIGPKSDRREHVG